jgi:hypothetical protein
MNTITTITDAIRIAAQLARHARQNMPLCLVGTVATETTRSDSATARVAADTAAQILFAATNGFEVRAINLAKIAQKSWGDTFVGD